MSDTWRGVPEPDPPRLDLADWVRVARRGVPVMILLAICFPLLLALRPPERMIWGLHRPITPHITRFACRMTVMMLGLRRDVRGAPMTRPGAYVSNHVSWLDIFVLNAASPLYFVAKSEVRGWPGIGWLARGTGTVFVDRRRGAARAQTQVFEGRLRAGHRLLFFPEGTTTDGRRVLAFKPTLFAALFSERLREHVSVQPVTLRYHAPERADPAFYGWWGNAGFGDGLLRVLAMPRQGRVEVTFHPALRVADFEGRKALAQVAEDAVRAPFAAPGS